MKKRMFILINIIFAILVTNNINAQNEKGFQDFWGVFYNALIKSDINKLNLMVNFPLEFDCILEKDNIDISTKSNFTKNFAKYFIKNRLNRFKNINKLTKPELYINSENKFVISILYFQKGESESGEMFDFEVINGKYRLVKIRTVG